MKTTGTFVIDNGDIKFIVDGIKDCKYTINSSSCDESVKRNLEAISKQITDDITTYNKQKLSDFKERIIQIIDKTIPEIIDCIKRIDYHASLVESKIHNKQELADKLNYIGQLSIALSKIVKFESLQQDYDLSLDDICRIIDARFFTEETFSHVLFNIRQMRRNCNEFNNIFRT